MGKKDSIWSGKEHFLRDSPKEKKKLKIPKVKLPSLLQKNLGAVILVLVLISILVIPKCLNKEEVMEEVVEEEEEAVEEEDLSEYRGMSAAEILAMLNEGKEVEDIVLKEFDMFAEKWIFSPREIKVNKGDFVKINIKALDADHNMRIPAYKESIQVPEGEIKTVTFFAEKTGEFRIESLGHESMEAKIIVEE